MKPKPSKNARKVLAAIKELTPTLKKIQAAIHQDPELSMHEHRAAARLCDFLEAEGFTVKRQVAGLPTAFRADAGDAKARPRAGVMCEYDALPGVGHACGHSIIAAAGVGAGAALHRAFPKMPVTVLGTPGEEVGIGKQAMIDGGVFKGIDYAIMVHPASNRQITRLFLGVVQRVYAFAGKPAHAAAFPEQGINALDAVVMLYNSVAALRQQLPEQAKVHSIITDGGQAPNVIPERAEAFYVIRALELDALANLVKKIDQCAKGAAKATGARVKITNPKGFTPPFNISRGLSAVYEEQVVAMGLTPFHGPEDKHIGSSDISNVSRIMPAIHPHVPIAKKPDAVAIHTREFERVAGGPAGKAAALEGATLLALTALSVWDRPSAFKKIVAEFKSSNHKIPPGLK